MIKINTGGSEQPLPPQGMVKVRRSQLTSKNLNSYLSAWLQTY